MLWDKSLIQITPAVSSLLTKELQHRLECRHRTHKKSWRGAVPFIRSLTLRLCRMPQQVAVCVVLNLLHMVNLRLLEQLRPLGRTADVATQTMNQTMISIHHLKLALKYSTLRCTAELLISSSVHRTILCILLRTFQLLLKPLDFSQFSQYLLSVLSRKFQTSYPCSRLFSLSFCRLVLQINNFLVNRLKVKFFAGIVLLQQQLSLLVQLANNLNTACIHLLRLGLRLLFKHLLKFFVMCINKNIYKLIRIIGNIPLANSIVQSRHHSAHLVRSQAAKQLRILEVHLRKFHKLVHC